MKKYQKVEIVAKNQVVGSYAAGCPAKDRGEECWFFNKTLTPGCKSCERSV